MGSLPLPLAPAIKPTGTLAAYLRRFMAEKVQDYRCDSCKDNTTTKERKQLINYAPDIISFQLKRTDNFGRKLNTVVAINPSIDLSSYLEAGHAPLHYELTAIIKHKGTPQSGHYIAFSKGPDGEWYGFDDSRKAKTSFATAISASTGFTPYILYFRRKED
jgi:ubiquitin C-terminal hydrolase